MVSLPHALLGLLSIEPRSGYSLTQALGEHGVGRYAWHAGHTSIYPELSRLATGGFIEELSAGPRGKRVYGVTGSGRDELRAWLIDFPVRPVTVRNDLVLRMFLLPAIGPDGAIAILRRILEHVEAESRELRAVREPNDGAVPAGPEGFGHIAAEYGVRADEAVAGWARWAITEFENRRDMPALLTDAEQ